MLAAQRVLLVLDNCEHLTDAVAEFVEVVCAAAPGVRVLATSQETLKTSDEHVYRLGSLAVPTRGGAEAREIGAVSLFVARAEAVDPRFSLTPENTPAVVEICRRLDGIPLAIELAAARLPLLGVEGLRVRLDERFSVLTAGARTVLRRHQTLRATFEWSHGLLAPEQQTVFRRLGVFAGSFTLEAAQQVVEDGAIDRWSALDHLGALVDKSLVLAEGDGIPRYRLLETARAYSLERLAEAGETPAMMRRHAEALLEQLNVFEREDEVLPARVEGWQAGAAELDNLRAALVWAAAPGDRGVTRRRRAASRGRAQIRQRVGFVVRSVEHRRGREPTGPPTSRQGAVLHPQSFGVVVLIVHPAMRRVVDSNDCLACGTGAEVRADR